MRNCDFLCVRAGLALLLGLIPAAAGAQTFESIGVRAQGLGGAFVAVADDATASWWNPAGQATGAYFSAVVEKGRTTEPVSPSASGPAVRTTWTDFAVGFPALGLSHYRLRISEIAPNSSTAGGSGNRQDPGGTGTSVRTVGINQYSATIGQSIGDAVVFGATVKLLQAGAVRATSTSASPLDDADGLDVVRQTKPDVDGGVMVRAGHLRFGMTVRNITTPSFGSGSTQLDLSRQARVGLAWMSKPRGLQTTVLAFDADLTTTDTATGQVRHVAAGMERWMSRGRLGLRGGVSANTIDTKRPAASGGVTFALTRAIQLNASRTIGRDESVTGWGASVSVTF